MKPVTNFIVELENYASFFLLYIFSFILGKVRLIELGIGFPCVSFSYYFTFNCSLVGHWGLWYLFLIADL